MKRFGINATKYFLLILSAIVIKGTISSSMASTEMPAIQSAQSQKAFSYYIQSAKNTQNNSEEWLDQLWLLAWRLDIKDLRDANGINTSEELLFVKKEFDLYWATLTPEDQLITERKIKNSSAPPLLKSVFKLKFPSLSTSQKIIRSLGSLKTMRKQRHCSDGNFQIIE
jgi:hypothetical protein